MQLLGQKHLESLSLLLIIVKFLVQGILTERSGKGAHCAPGSEWLGVGYFWPFVIQKVCQDIASMSNITSAEVGSLWPQNVYSCFKVIFKVSNSFVNKCHLPSISFSTESKWKKQSSAQRVTSALFYEPCCLQRASDVGNTASELLKMVLKNIITDSVKERK